MGGERQREREIVTGTIITGEREREREREKERRNRRERASRPPPVKWSLPFAHVLDAAG